MRKFAFALILLLALSFVFSQFAHLEEFMAVLQRGQPGWIALAFLVQATWLLNQTAQYRAAFRVLGVERSIRELLPLVLASNFLNVAMPSGGISGVAVLLTDAQRHGYSTARVTLAGVLYIVFDYIAFSIVLALGLAVLIRRNNLSAIEIIPSIIMFCAAIGLSAIVLLGMRSADALGRVLITAARVINWIVRPVIRRGYISEQIAHNFAVEAAEGLKTLRNMPRGRWLYPIALSLSSKALLIALLFLIFLAFDQPFTVGTLTAGFSIGYLFTIVSPTPMGIGVVEGVMTLALKTLRVPLEAAAIITIVFRSFTVWLPLMYGSVALPVSRLRRK